MQDVVLHQFVVLSGVIMIEYGFRLFVLKEFQRNECKAFACHKDIDTAERILQPVRFAESLFQVGSEGQGIVHSVLVERKSAFAERIEYRKRKSIRTQTDG